MSTTTTPPGNGQAPPVDPNVIQRPPGHGSGPSDTPPPAARGHWYRRGWVIALGALLVGVGIGGAVGSSKTAPRAATVTAPAHTIINTVTRPTKTVVHVRKVPGPTTTVSGPTTTVTQTVQTTTSAPTTTSGGGGGTGSSGALSWSGNGIKKIGTINVPVDSVIKWTNDGGMFSIYDDENAVEVSSQAASGQSDLAAGTYHGFQVNAIGNWTIDIVPK